MELKVKNKNPLIYIVMPCYNGEKYLLEQLMSIYYQNYTNWYLIFVNDGSTDNSENIIRDWVSHYNLHDKVKIINKENGGVNTAVQRGLEEIKDMCDIQNTDSLVSYCDADDVWIRCKLEIQVEYMVNHPECDLSYHDLILINENGKEIRSYFKYFYPNRDYFYLFTMGNYFTSTEMMFKPKYIDYILPMPTGNGMYQDWWSGLVFGIKGLNTQFINQALVYYRTGHPSLMNKAKKDGIKRKYENRVRYYYFLKNRFPEIDMTYIYEYNEDRYINWYNKQYSLIHIYILMLCKYPKIFFLGLKCQLRRLYKFGTLNPEKV